MDHSQFYNDYYSLPSELCSYSTPVLSEAMWGRASSTEESNQLVPIFCHNNGAPSFDVVSPESDVSAATLPELLGFPDYSHLGLDGSIGGGQLHQSFGDQECCDGFMPAYSKPLDLDVQENWGFNQGNQVPTMEDQSMKMKVGIRRYSDEERKERIERYLKKRHQRNFNKTIKYACRKTLADRRVRVRGRFARNSGNESNDQHINHEDSKTHQEMAQNKIENNCDYRACFDRHEQMYCSTGANQIKYDEDDWIQEAMASLAYLPYVTAG